MKNIAFFCGSFSSSIFSNLSPLAIANGAVTSAFQHLFNNEATLARQRSEYNALVDGGMRGLATPWNPENRHFKSVLNGNEAESAGKKPMKFSWGSLISRTAKIARGLRGNLFEPNTISSHVPESSKVIYTRDFVNHGEIVDVIFGFLHTEAGYGDTIRNSQVFEVSGTLNGLWSGRKIEGIPDRSISTITPSTVVDPIWMR